MHSQFRQRCKKGPNTAVIVCSPESNRFRPYNTNGFITRKTMIKPKMQIEQEAARYFAEDRTGLDDRVTLIQRGVNVMAGHNSSSDIRITARTADGAQGRMQATLLPERIVHVLGEERNMHVQMETGDKGPASKIGNGIAVMQRLQDVVTSFFNTPARTQMLGYDDAAALRREQATRSAPGISSRTTAPGGVTTLDRRTPNMHEAVDMDPISMPTVPCATHFFVSPPPTFTDGHFNTTPREKMSVRAMSHVDQITHQSATLYPLREPGQVHMHAGRPEGITAPPIDHNTSLTANATTNHPRAMVPTMADNPSGFLSQPPQQRDMPTSALVKEPAVAAKNIQQILVDTHFVPVSAYTRTLRPVTTVAAGSLGNHRDPVVTDDVVALYAAQHAANVPSLTAIPGASHMNRAVVDMYLSPQRITTATGGEVKEFNSIAMAANVTTKTVDALPSRDVMENVRVGDMDKPRNSVRVVATSFADPAVSERERIDPKSTRLINHSALASKHAVGVNGLHRMDVSGALRRHTGVGSARCSVRDEDMASVLSFS